MAWATNSKISYLDGVSFAINPLFVPVSDQDHDEIEGLFYDLDRANSILNFKHEFFTENKILLEDNEDQQDYDTDMIDASGSSNDLRRPKSSSFLQATEKNQESILKLLNDFKSPLAFQASLSSASDQSNDVKFNLGSNSPTPSNNLSCSLPPVSQFPSNIYPNAQIANIAFNAQTLKNNRSTENFENISKSPRIENEAVANPVLSTTVPANAIKKIPTYSNSILEPIRPLASTAQASNQDELLQRGRNEIEDRTRAKENERKSGISLDIFSEAPSADPFNDMELKSINDIEELKNILNQHQMQQTSLITNSSSVSEGTLEVKSNLDSAGTSANSVDTVTNHSESKPNKVITATTPLTTSNSIQPLLNSTTTTVASLPCAVDNYGLPNIKFNDLDF